MEETKKEVIAMAENGKGDYEDWVRVAIERGELNPLHIVAIDHTHIDVEIVDEKTGKTLTNSFIAVAVDSKPRMVWFKIITEKEKK
jgi:hypothetical protein